MRILIAVMILFLVVPLASAGELFNVEVSKEDTLINLDERDAIAFSFKGGDHRLMIREVNGKDVDLTLFRNIGDDKSNEDGNVPTYFTLKAGNQISNFDLDKDGENDVTVYIFSVNEKKILLDIKEYEPKDIKDTTGNVIKDSNLISVSSVIWTVILLTIVISLAVLVFRRRSTS